MFLCKISSAVTIFKIKSKSIIETNRSQTHDFLSRTDNNDARLLADSQWTDTWACYNFEARRWTGGQSLEVIWGQATAHNRNPRGQRRCVARAFEADGN